MTFSHPDVQQFYDRAMSLKVGGVSDEERPVFALMDAYGWFRLIDGQQSAKIQELVSNLLSPELRPALRRWYRRHENIAVNNVFFELGKHLSDLAGEKFV
jgi:hypothetical protein